MNNTTIAVTILREAYEAHFRTTQPYNVYKVWDESQMDAGAFGKIVQVMAHTQELIVPRPDVGNYSITPKGILYAEERGIAPIQLQESNRLIRERTISHLAKEPQRKFDVFNLPPSISSEPRLIAQNNMVLAEQGYVEVGPGGGIVKITGLGLALG